MNIHLGCGKRRLPGFLHIDPDEDNAPDRIGSAECIPLPDNSADLLYFCHGIEHVKKRYTGQVVSEFKRVLKPGGTLRLSTPDFATICSLYLFGGVSLTRLGCINGGQRNDHDIHYAVYDFEHLACLLHRDFYDIREYDPLEVLPPGYDDYSLARINDRLISLNLEAVAK